MVPLGESELRLLLLFFCAGYVSGLGVRHAHLCQPSHGPLARPALLDHSNALGYATVDLRAFRAGQRACARCGSWSSRRTAITVGHYYLPYDKDIAATTPTTASLRY